MPIFTYGNGDPTLPCLLWYAVLFVSKILTIAKFGLVFLQTILTVLIYSILLTSEAGKYFIFDTSKQSKLFGRVVKLNIIFVAKIISQ